MPLFTLQEFEQTGPRDNGELRPLGERQFHGITLPEGKQWLTRMLQQNRLAKDRFYRFSAPDCSTELRQNVDIHLAFCVFANARLCPVRIWNTRAASDSGSPDEWTVDFLGIPGWAWFASIEPRWKVERRVPIERSWMGRSRRDWRWRDCWFTEASNQITGECAA